MIHVRVLWWQSPFLLVLSQYRCPEEGTLELIGVEMKEEGAKTCKKTTKAKIKSAWHTVGRAVPRPEGQSPVCGALRGATRQGENEGHCLAYCQKRCANTNTTGACSWGDRRRDTPRKSRFF